MVSSLTHPQAGSIDHNQEQLLESSPRPTMGAAGDGAMQPAPPQAGSLHNHSHDLHHVYPG